MQTFGLILAIANIDGHPRLPLRRLDRNARR